MDFFDGYSGYDFYMKRLGERASAGVHTGGADGRIVFTEPDALQITWHLATTVSSLHSKKIYHRDIKPENIILDKDIDKVYLVDFGFSIVSEFGMGMYTGHTRGFAAPECCKPDPNPYHLGPADVYSLGKTLYWLLTDGKF